MHPSAVPNMFLKLIKYPTALGATVALPYAWAHLMTSPLMSLSPLKYQWFAAGFVGYLLAWWVLFQRRFMGSYFSTFEHELTHAIFAWLTLHRVVGLSVTWQRGGSCTFEGSGGGNWLIAIAPYWFPTLVIPTLGVVYFSTGQSLTQLHGLVGAATAYHILSTWTETHLRQPDLQNTGFLFALMFLPAANIIVYSVILLFTLCGPVSAHQYLHNVFQDTLLWFTSMLRS